MPIDNTWPDPSPEATEVRLAAINPSAYARTRNHLKGAVTGLSPYLTHGMITLADVYHHVTARYTLPREHSLVRELGWRAFFAHAWAHLQDGIHQSQRPGPLPEAAYATTMPADIAAGCTGVPAIDHAVHTLHTTGLLHNHARLWLASYVVHGRRVHWHTGARWMYSLLLDGDLASNHLSWQWVAGTFSSKPYVFNADNVAQFAPPAWHSRGSAIDLSYLDWQQLAAGQRPALPSGPTPTANGTPDHAVTQPPPELNWQAPSALPVRGKRVQLLHPWAVGQLDPSASCRIGVAMAAWHHAHPWHARRWHWIHQAMQPHTNACWWVTHVGDLALALAQASEVSVVANGHMLAAITAISQALMTHAQAPRLRVIEPAALFTSVQPMARSFSAWWRRTQLA